VLVVGLLAMASLAPSAQAAPVPLGEAANFAVLAGSTVTNTGPSVISGGHVGVSPGSAVTGFGPGTVTPPSTIHRADSIALQAKNDLTTAYDNVAGRAPGERIFADLAGRTLEPGVYTATSSLALNGDLTLDANGDPNAEFIFQAGSTLLVGTTTVSAVRLINGAQASNVYWQVGSSATIGVNSALAGNVLALTSITMQTNTSLNGRALARNGAVTLETTTITTPAAAQPPGPECVIQSDAGLEAGQALTSEGHYPYQEWLANPSAQTAVDALDAALDARFGDEDEEGNPLRAGLIGTAADHRAQEIVVVVDPALVEPSELETQLRAAVPRDALSIRVGRSCHSSLQLLDAQATIDARSWHPLVPSTAYTSYLDAKTSTFIVGLSVADEPVASALVARLGSRVTIDLSGAPSRDSRLNDGEPHWGGAGIGSTRGANICTSSFTVRFSTGPLGSLTTGHCFRNGQRIWSGTQFYGVAFAESGFPRFDMIGIRPNGERFDNRIHTEPGNPSSREVQARGNPSRHSFVCMSGMVTRAKCGLEVIETDADLCDPSGCTPNLVRSMRRGTRVRAPGDSGGTVYNRFGSNGAAIRGMHVGGRRRDESYAHKVRSIERHLNVTVAR